MSGENSTKDIDADTITQIVHRVTEDSFKRKQKSSCKKPVHWWNEKLTIMTEQTNAVRHEKQVRQLFLTE